MTAADVPLGMRLKQQAGWNQTEADWRRFLDLEPDGCFVAELDGAAVGTTVTCVFGPVAWVAMVLVDAAVRGRGVGTALMRHALDYLDARGVRTVRLDATPLGQPIYEKLGFAADFTLARYAGVLPPAPAAPGEVEPVAAVGLASLLRLDADVTRTTRVEALMRIYAENEASFRVVRRGDEVIAFLGSRPGAKATQVGPWAATDEPAARLLLNDACARLAAQSVFIDVPLPNAAAIAAVGSTGLTPQRQLLRMTRGEPLRERVEMLWASSGPEKG
jgi:GNAT superfamily N-acetyltransferase